MILLAQFPHFVGNRSVHLRWSDNPRDASMADLSGAHRQLRLLTARVAAAERAAGGGENSTVIVKVVNAIVSHHFGADEGDIVGGERTG